jgi:hypothetical protein
MNTGCSTVSPLRLQRNAAGGTLPERYAGVAYISVMRPRHDKRPMFSGSERNSLDDHSMEHVAVRQSLSQSKVTPGRAVTESTIPSNGAAANTTASRKGDTVPPGAHTGRADGEVQTMQSLRPARGGEVAIEGALQSA